jgi:hypothetical protein
MDDVTKNQECNEREAARRGAAGKMQRDGNGDGVFAHFGAIDLLIRVWGM